ncbi:hypothetical protein EWF20_00890 [Sulfolobus sp. S-194]|uniref:hypothetical protein n=1 Tax=Sulfolobus sp. S-194 TaxID=2512240 RepID=UPI001437004A|nr:hypothetical protein [Sulfolobus sp. S-194]QIW22854.1 hypothetical protein EWF20_00890 [Sulfolobus sp. S-194]
MLAEELNAKVNRLLDNYIVFDGEFLAFTPWWGGNELGYTFYPQPHYPEPKEIIGKTKWTIRTLCGNVPEKLGISEKNASTVKVSVSILSHGEMYFDKIPNIDDMIGKSGGRSSKTRSYLDLLRDMREEGYKLLFPSYSSATNPHLNREFGGLYKLLTIPRFYLKAMGRRSQRQSEIIQEIFKSQPMKPGFKIRIRVFSRDKEVSKLFVNAMLITLKYLGIGSAANRGFGRFKLTKISHAIEGIKKDLDITKEIIVECKREGNSSFPRFPSPQDIRVIKPVNAYIRRNKYRAEDIEGVLAAIGISTLKSTWKSVCNAFMGSGRGYHTWVLGLPREVNGKGYISKNGELRRQSYIVMSPTEDLGVILLPFYVEDYTKIYHSDHGQVEVTNINRVNPNCKTLPPSQVIKEHVDLALDWLEEILR